MRLEPASRLCPVASLKRSDDAEVIGTGNLDALVAIGPGVVPQTPEAVLLLHGLGEEAVARCANETEVKLGVHFEEGDGVALVPALRHELAVPFAHVREPGAVEAVVRFQQRGRLDGEPEAIGGGARLRRVGLVEEAPAEAGFAHYQAQIGQTLERGGDVQARGVVASHQLRLGHVVRQLTRAPGAGKRLDQRVHPRHGFVRNRHDGRVNDCDAAALLADQTDIRQMRQRRADRRSRHAQLLGDGELVDRIACLQAGLPDMRGDRLRELPLESAGRVG